MGTFEVKFWVLGKQKARYIKVRAHTHIAAISAAMKKGKIPEEKIYNTESERLNIS